MKTGTKVAIGAGVYAVAALGTFLLRGTLLFGEGRKTAQNVLGAAFWPVGIPVAAIGRASERQKIQSLHGTPQQLAAITHFTAIEPSDLVSIGTMSTGSVGDLPLAVASYSDGTSLTVNPDGSISAASNWLLSPSGHWYRETGGRYVTLDEGTLEATPA